MLQFQLPSPRNTEQERIRLAGDEQNRSSEDSQARELDHSPAYSFDFRYCDNLLLVDLRAIWL